uniref:WAP domain-containing protein n=1 Tax=Petromyzon marinus TaxID=7757 RepID=S4RCB1_PETMA
RVPVEHFGGTRTRESSRGTLRWHENPAADKPGSCPKQRPGTIGICVNLCKDDDSCTGEQKCCSNGCGRTCMEPVRPDKPGACAFVNMSNIRCESHDNKCADDQDCQGDRKCCNTGCRKECTKPVKRKPGFCPYVNAQLIKCAYRPDLNRCQQDWQCPGKEKCCSSGCLMICRKPGTPASITPQPGEQQMEMNPAAVKVGSCPVEDTYCIARQGDDEEEDCADDTDCPGDKKCCSLACGIRCLDPEPCSVVKPGSCPIRDY